MSSARSGWIGLESKPQKTGDLSLLCTYDFNYNFLEGFTVLALENGTEATLSKTVLNYVSVIDNRLDHIGLIFKDEGDFSMVLTRSINQFLLIHLSRL